MIYSIAIGWPGPFEMAMLACIGLLIPAAVVLLILRVPLFRRHAPPSAFPVIEPDGPGTYRVAGVDKNTRADRTFTVNADSRANAQVKAELDGIVVTSVTKQT